LISTSFKPVSDVFSTQLIPAHPTLSNYQYVLTNSSSGGAADFLVWLKNSLLIALLTTLVGLGLSSPAAYAVSRWNFLGKQGLLLSFLITQMFPGVLLIVPLYILFARLNLLDNIFGLVVAYATTALPFSVWMLKNFFDAVPKELDEASRVDGLGPFQTFWRIILPLTIPGVAVVGFFNFMTSWNEFMMAFTFLSSNDALTLPVGIQHFVNVFNVQWQYLTAAAVMMTIPVLLLFFWAQRYLISGLTGGSVKG
ncbi:MAG TPA: carbohydrate ABC transporter permease, partial [Ktedonobacteraceae bacterium]|nr:carbohydrate ABC transporter permease [Ktedonobacteraceae bacterium]